MDYIYVITGLFTIAFAIAGLVLTCYLERRWLNSLKTKSNEDAGPGLSVDGLST